jgi:predicted dehydrogenase
MGSKAGIALIGCGWAGIRHARAFVKCGGVIRWAVDTNPIRAGAIRELQQGIRISNDYRDALADRDVDAVDICLPHDLHAQVAIDSAQAGKHILCEKPIAATLAEADRMIEAADRAMVILMVAENERFSPLYRKVCTLLAEGVIGKPALVQMTRECYLRRSFIEDRPWFLNAKAAAGGIMMSGGTHDFEKLRMIIGEVESVYSLRASQRFPEMEGDDTSVALIRFCNGTVCTMVESFIMKTAITASGPEVHTLRIDGELGSIRAEGTNGGVIHIFSERGGTSINGCLTEYEILVPEDDTFKLEIEHFLKCIEMGETPETSGRSQRRPLELVLAAYRSMETGQPVKVTPHDSVG